MGDLHEPLPEHGHWDRWENRTATSYVWGEPEKIGQLAQDYSKAGAELERLTNEFGKLSGGDFWKGDAANAFVAARDKIVSKLEQAKRMHTELSNILKAYGLGTAGTVGGADGGLDQWKTDAATAFTEGQAAYQDWKKEQGIIDLYNQWLKDPKSVQKPPPEQEKNSASVRQHNIEPRLKAAAAKLGEARETRNSSGSFTGSYIKDTIATASFPNDNPPPGYPPTSAPSAPANPKLGDIMPPGVQPTKTGNPPRYVDPRNGHHVQSFIGPIEPGKERPWVYID